LPTNSLAPSATRRHGEIPAKGALQSQKHTTLFGMKTRHIGSATLNQPVLCLSPRRLITDTESSSTGLLEQSEEGLIYTFSQNCHRLNTTQVAGCQYLTTLVDALVVYKICARAEGKSLKTVMAVAQAVYADSLPCHYGVLSRTCACFLPHLRNVAGSNPTAKASFFSIPLRPPTPGGYARTCRAGSHTATLPRRHAS